jgi:hypothetical protein
MTPNANGAGGGGGGGGGGDGGYFAPGRQGYMNPAPGAPVHTQTDPATGFNPLFPFFSPPIQMPYEAPTPPKEMKQQQQEGESAAAVVQGKEKLLPSPSLDGKEDGTGSGGKEQSKIEHTEVTALSCTLSSSSI